MEDDDAAAESTVQADYSDEDDPSVYLERVLTGLSME
ncbi:host-inducible protein A-like protein [Bradyrhizobium diazoefficiens]|uniref:Host-inducible protein A-like protein n=1 Tax=Bradyrhizobium diazoefficiens TaxID=1355477 RepID=A0A0E4FUE9_9BRAD|nr:host-inducible protein A-like protein [Bradyrhizobium diazoefficiens]